MIGLIIGLLVLIYLKEYNIMAAIDNLNTNIATLTTDVQAFVAAHPAGAATEAQIQAAADAVAALDATVKATPAA